MWIINQVVYLNEYTRAGTRVEFHFKDEQPEMAHNILRIEMINNIKLHNLIYIPATGQIFPYFVEILVAL